MKGHAPKSLPDRILSGLVLRTILTAENEELYLTSKEIHTYISQNTFQFELPDRDADNQPVLSDHYTCDNLPQIRTTISYCIRAGYLMKRGEEKPFYFLLTEEGRQMAADPWFKYKLKQQYFMKLAEEEVKRLLNNDEQIEYLAEQKRIEKCETCKINQPPRERLRAKSWTVRPHKGKIGIQRPDGQIIEIEVTPEGLVQELEDLKAGLVIKNGSVDTQSTILSLQNENQYMRKVLSEAGIRYEKQSVELAKEKGRKTARTEKEFIRQMDRMEVTHYYVENNLYLDAQFFNIWSGSLVVVEYKRTLDMQILSVFYDIQSTRGEIMTRTDYARRILEPEEIEAVGIFVTEIRDSSIVVDSEHFQAPKALQV
jgi:hypothetical protein